MRRQSFNALITTGWLLLLAGCGIQPETLESLREVVQTVSAPAPSVDPVVDAAGQDLAFEAPFPDRTDPFAFPAHAQLTEQAGTTITTAAQVDVLGFAEVDHPRVFLKTNDTTKSLRVGEMIDGVEVLAIEPPNVELRMGTLVWTVSMFENTRVPGK